MQVSWAEFECANAALACAARMRRAARRVTEPYAQSIHWGHGGTRGEVLSRTADGSLENLDEK